MRYLFNPDGGEMMVSNYNTRIEAIPNLIVKVAEIFSDLLDIKPFDREFCYCIQFDPLYRNLVNALLIDIERNGLPKGTAFYDCDGKRLFELRGAAGGVVHAMCFYLITKESLR